MSNIETSRDSFLNQINALAWLPWVGQQYFKNSRKLLIIGESQYAKGATQAIYNKDFKNVENRSFTRNMIQFTQINHDYGHPALDNLKDALFNDSLINDVTLWQNLSYYNFVQRVLDYRKDPITKNVERPVIADYDLAWEVFISIVKVLQPSDCIFIGVESANSVERMMDKMNVKRGNRLLGKKINGAFSRSISIEVNGKEIKLSFIKHSSERFSASLWSQFLLHNHNQVINELLKKIT